MRRTLTTAATCMAIVMIVIPGARCTSTPSAEETAPARVELTGEFDPYECHDDKAEEDKVVMKSRPDCGSCHAEAVVYRDDQGLSRLSLSVHYGGENSKPGEWDLAGEPGPEGIVFSKPKFRLVYAKGELHGDFKGKMNAKIRLTPKDDVPERTNAR